MSELRARLQLVDEALLSITGDIADGRLPDDEAELDRCRLVAGRVATKGRRLPDLLAGPTADGLEARVVAETDRVIDEARDRQQGTDP